MTTNTHNLGMGLVELVLALVVIAGVLGLMIVVTNSLRAESAEAATRQTLSLLRATLRYYHEQTQRWPAGDANSALATLIKAADAQSPINALALVANPNGTYVVRDGYGRPLAYQPSQTGHEPDFVSAGPDGQFGDPQSPDPDARLAVIDNLYASESDPRQP